MNRRRKLINLSMASLVAIVLPVRSGSGPATPGPVNGQAAINALGGRLGSVARSNGLTGADLRARLRGDSTLHVDPTGRLLVVDTDLGGAPAQHGDTVGAPAVADAPTVAAAVAYDQTFHLHSRPGSQRVVYLDFDGHDVAGTAWNVNYTGNAAFTAEPYDTDGVAGFSNAEMDVVQRVWQRVAEDYAAFDVDITTEQPSQDAIARTTATDQVYGTRLVVTPTQNVYSLCTCGGIAYVGVFDLASNHDYYQPAFVFTRGVGNGDKNIAEAASHEVGHTLGLYHDGTSTVGYYAGQGPWAPIMGVGYYKPVTQWSRGEYANANNLQDDLAVMQSHGLALRADDHGNSAATATMLQGTALSATGVISTGTDSDWFGFVAGAGSATFNVSPSPYGPDLDVRLDLLDGNGNPIAQSDPAAGITSADIADGLDASITVTFQNQGTYFLKVTGTGHGDPATTGYSNYASLGHYTLTGTIGQADASNASPVAVASATPTAVAPGQSVNFSAAGSLDPDGVIAGYTWNFGDGGTSNLASPQHAYATPGTFTVTLTVTDGLGATGTATQSIDVLPPNVRVQSIRPSLVQRSGRTTATALVTITDSIGRPVRGALVQASWSGSVTSPASGTTGAAGTVLLSSPPVSLRSASFTITVVNVIAPGQPYSAVLNLVSSATIRR